MDENPSERRDDGANDAATPRAIVDTYVSLVGERLGQMEIVDGFVETYLATVRAIADEFAQLVPHDVPVANEYACTPGRTRCIQKMRFDGLLFSFVHIREVAFLSFAPVPDEIAGQVGLYVQEIPTVGGIPIGEGHLVSSLLIYPVRKEWRFQWGMTPGALHSFDDT